MTVRHDQDDYLFRGPGRLPSPALASYVPSRDPVDEQTPLVAPIRWQGQPPMSAARIEDRSNAMAAPERGRRDDSGPPMKEAFPRARVGGRCPSPPRPPPAALPPSRSRRRRQNISAQPRAALTLHAEPPLTPSSRRPDHRVRTLRAPPLPLSPTSFVVAREPRRARCTSLGERASPSPAARPDRQGEEGGRATRSVPPTGPHHRRWDWTTGMGCVAGREGAGL